MHQRELPDLVAQDLAGLVPDNLFVFEGFPMALRYSLVDDDDVFALAVIVAREANGALDSAHFFWCGSIDEGRAVWANMVSSDMD